MASRTPAASDTKDKRAAILRAATLLFSRYGYRKTSIDLVASEASVAKPTIYAYFADKDALFVSVCTQLFEGILGQARAAADVDEALPTRLAAILAAKFTTLYELVHRSPHAGELLVSKDALAAPVIADADARFFELLLREVTRADRAGELRLRATGLDAPKFAASLQRAAHGAQFGARTVAEQRAALELLVRVLVRGAGHVEATPAKKPPRGRRA